MSTVIITGSTGLVGSEAVEFFCKKKFHVVGIDNNLRKYFFGKDGDTKWIKNRLTNKFKNYTHINCDIRNKKIIKKIFQKFNKDIKLIIHAAGQPSHDWAIKEPFTDFSINAEGTLNLLNYTKEFAKNSPFIFLSTNKVYGDNPNKFKFRETKNRYSITGSKFKHGFNEDLNVDNCVHSLFGVSKLSADMLVQEYGKNIGLKTVCFRAGCITGSNHSGAKLHGFLSYLVKRTVKERSYDLIGFKGKQVRDNIHSKDLINCFWHFFQKPSSGKVYNIGGGSYSNCSILEAIHLVEKKLSIKIKKNLIQKPRIGDHQWYISNIHKFSNDYKKWTQTYSIEMIIDDLLKTELEK